MIWTNFYILERIRVFNVLFLDSSFFQSLPYSDNMSFVERWYNTFITMFDALVRNWIYLPAQEQLAQKHFAHLAPLPPLRDILNNISISLVNSHRAITPPRPSMPSNNWTIIDICKNSDSILHSFQIICSFRLTGVIQIGGSHIKPVKPLPNDLKKFLDEAPQGVIYFSLGSVVQSSQLPKEFIKSFLSMLLRHLCCRALQTNQSNLI